MPKEKYSVGFRKPPKHSRFRKGQSGNPKGRRKGVRNFNTELEEALKAPVTLREHGQEKRISVKAGLIKAALAKAMNGDVRMVAFISNWARELESNDEEANDNDEISPEDKELVDQFLGRGNDARIPVRSRTRDVSSSRSDESTPEPNEED